MKKLIGVTLIIALCMGVSSCSRPALMVLSPVAPAMSTEAVLGDIQMSTISSGLLMNSTTGIGDSFFTIRGYVDATADVIEYSIANRQIQELGSSDSPTVPDVLGGAVLASTNDKILLFKLGHVPYKDLYEGTSSQISVLNVDGKITNIISLSADQLFKLNSAVAHDGNGNIYVVLCTYDDGNEGPDLVKEMLCRINVDTGKIEELHSLSLDRSTIITGVYPDGLILTNISNPNNAYAHSEIIQTAISCFSISANKMTSNEMEWLSGPATSVADTDGTVYYIRSDESILRSFDLVTGKDDVVIEKFNIAGKEGYLPFIAGEIYDNHLIVALDNSTDAILVSVNLETKEIAELTLKGKDEAGDEIYVSICYEGDSFFVVCTGYEYISTTQTAEGKSYTFDEHVPICQTIDKANFWGNVSEYRSFDDYVFRLR